MKFRLFILVLLGNISFTPAQEIATEKNWLNEIENSCDLVKPNMLSNHPLGIFISRINHNFKIRAAEKSSFSVDISSGNVMLPYVKSYQLTNPVDQLLAESVPWHIREFMFDLDKVPAKTKEFIADGVIRSYRFTFTLPISVHHELSFSLRSYSLDKGKYPFSILTSDASIEWFHSNIAGGEDPFSRRHYGFDQATIAYKDENNKTITIRNGDFIIPGVELTYFYYPKLNMNEKHKLYLNFGTHIGINTSRYNPVMDFGISSSAIKKIIVRNKNVLSVGVSSGALRQRLLEYGSRVNFSNQNYLCSIEGLVDYKKKLRNNNSISWGINYAFQNSYSKKGDYKHTVFTGERIKTHWQQTLYHTFKDLEGWNFICTYSVKQISYFVYLREDIKLDNAPDLQAGFGIKLSLKR